MLRNKLNNHEFEPCYIKGKRTGTHTEAMLKNPSIFFTISATIFMLGV
jgi:hypothetical protein